MSFSGDIKKELLENKLLRLRYKRLQAHGLFLFCKDFSEGKMGISTEIKELAELYAKDVKRFAGRSAKILIEEKFSGKKPLFVVSVVQKKDRLALLEGFYRLKTPVADSSEEIGAFVSGAYLACGAASDPIKSYHLEFVVKDSEKAMLLKQTLEDILIPAAITQRRGSYIIYYKDCEKIEDLLTFMGAPKASLGIIDVEIFKNVRNKANRVTNCETANIDKQVEAATDQIEDIKLIFLHRGKDYLPDNLLEAAIKRLENPELSLGELACEMPQKISRSGLHHRFDRIAKIADEIRSENNGEKKID